MRPQHLAADNPVQELLYAITPPASMRPQHLAADNTDGFSYGKYVLDLLQ